MKYSVIQNPKGVIFIIIEYKQNKKPTYQRTRNIQNRATKMIPEVEDLSYKERMAFLRLPSLAYRKIRGDVIEMYK